MAAPAPSPFPSVDRLLQSGEAAALIEQNGRAAVADAVRSVLAELRRDGEAGSGEAAILARAAQRLAAEAAPSLRPVFNLTGTVLHTNLGRAVLPREALDAVVLAAASPANLEYDLAAGRRGDRDDHLEPLLCRLTGAEAATVVNNNAAAVLLVLNSLALRQGGADLARRTDRNRRRVPHARHHGALRRRLREVGTTNRTHLRDYAEAIGPKTGPGDEGPRQQLRDRGICRRRRRSTSLPRSATSAAFPSWSISAAAALIDLRALGLPHEPTPMEALKNGADVVTFSGDKLLGGPQAGLIVGRRDIIARIKRNPLKRALRVDKMTIAALAAVLRLYRDPDRLVEQLPTLRALARPAAVIRALADRLAPCVGAWLGPDWSVAVIDCATARSAAARLPTQRIASAGLALRPLAKRGAGTALKALAEKFRALSVPVIGRIEDDALVLDLRCLEDEARSSQRAARRHDRRHRRPRRSRQDAAREGADRRRCRPPARGEAARHDHRPGLRLSAGRGRADHRLHRRAGARAFRP